MISEDAKVVILAQLKEALDILVSENDYDAILYVVAMMKRVHNGD